MLTLLLYCLLRIFACDCPAQFCTLYRIVWHTPTPSNFQNSTPTQPNEIAELVRVVGGHPDNKTLKAGDYFGQEVIIDQQKYGSTVVSLQTITGWKIDRAVLTNTVPVAKLRRAR
mmetsp:Transcript_20717/g.57571  ORF Transcript_20717/g.57571 Transcript_20717/m.57571 type:complete len:115 (-) Transcript_20717:528-872(-)